MRTALVLLVVIALVLLLVSLVRGAGRSTEQQDGGTAAETAAARLVATVPALGIPELTAAAGIAPLTDDADAAEVLRRALLSLTAARRVGAGTVIRYREPQ